MNEIQIFFPPNAVESDIDSGAGALYFLSEMLTRGLVSPEDRAFGLGGEFGYGVNYENDVFYMHRFCWCEKNDGSCLYCLHGDHPDFDRLLKERWGTSEYQIHAHRRYYDPPLFQFKPRDLRVTWYKWIGRDMASNIDVSDWRQVVTDCWNSLPEDVRRKANKERQQEAQA